MKNTSEAMVTVDELVRFSKYPLEDFATIRVVNSFPAWVRPLSLVWAIIWAVTAYCLAAGESLPFPLGWLVAFMIGCLSLLKLCDAILGYRLIKKAAPTAGTDD